MNFLTIILLYFLFLETFGRPAHVLQDYKDSRENSYRDSDIADSDDYIHEEEKSSLKQFSGNDPDTKIESLDENVSNSKEEATPDKDYLENNYEDKASSALESHMDVTSKGNSLKRTPGHNIGNVIFQDNEKSKQFQKIEDNEDYQFGSREHVRYLKQRNAERNIKEDALNRNRRQLKITTDEISTQKNSLMTCDDEEATIRRHVKKLSKEELDELLQSLSEDKRMLLKNIIEETDNINKREITKKAGANEENSLVGNEQTAVASKIYGDLANLEVESSMAPNSKKEDNINRVDTELMSSKGPDLSNSSEKSNDKVNLLDSIEDKQLITSDSVGNSKPSQTESSIFGISDSDQEISKKENKREIRSEAFIQSQQVIEDPKISDSSNKQDLYSPENEELSQLWDEQTNLYDADKSKREVCKDNLNSITSLEESFPNAENLNNLRPGSDMEPLVRVKRNNPDKTIEKRDVNGLSNVPYFSNALVNNEDDSDEGGEFLDDGYFDRGANFAKSDVLSNHVTSDSRNDRENHIKYYENLQPTHIDKNKLKIDAVNLGSDTDVIPSGVEGVDDNMMYNSVTRIRRTGNLLDKTHNEGENSKIRYEIMPQVSFQDDNEMSEEYNNAPRYQENEAFGSLPQNYDHDQGRFKRIRRLKPDSAVPVVEQ